MRLAYRLTDPSLARDAETRQTIDTASTYLVTSTGDLLAEWGDSAETVVWLARRALETRAGRGADSLDRLQLLANWLAQRGHAIESRRTLPNMDRTISSQSGSMPCQSRRPTASLPTLNMAGRGTTSAGCASCRSSECAAVRPTSERSSHQINRGPRTTTARTGFPYWRASVHAWYTLAQHDTTAAMREFAAVPDSICNSCGYVFLTRAQLFFAHGQYAEAAKVLDERGTKCATK